jgi:gluconolactonase
MKSIPLRSASFALVFASFTACSSSRSPVAPGAVPKDHGLIGAGEGPAWKDGSLYFTDGQHINRMDPKGRTTVFRHNASNGLLFDQEGRLVACESGLRRVTRTEKDGRITVLADRFEGKRFNTPNDLCMDSKGRIYFTDPRYGSREGMEIVELRPTDNELSEYYDEGEIVQRKFTLVEGVYRIDAPGKITRILCEGAERPNGIFITPDDQYLFIADNHNNTHGGSRKLLRYDLDENGDVKSGSRKVIFDWKDGRGPDGMKQDAAGRIYVAAGTNRVTEWETNEFKAGCYILSPRGRLIDFIPTAPDEACNCALGGSDKRTLFITSGNHLWSVPLK